MLRLDVFQPFASEYPKANVHEMLSGDLLHQLSRGTFKDHLVTWVGEYLALVHGSTRGKELLDEIPTVRHVDCRLCAVIAHRTAHLCWHLYIPPFPGLRHFKQGPNFMQWTGDDSEGLMKACPSQPSHCVPSR